MDGQALERVSSAEPIGPRHWRVRLLPGVGIGAFARAVVERGFGLEELRGEDASLEQAFLAIAAADLPEAVA